MQDESTATITDTDNNINNDNTGNMDSVLDAKVDSPGEVVEQPVQTFEWSKEVSEDIKAEFKTPEELAKAYSDLMQSTLPPEDGKYDYEGKSISKEYIDSMQGLMKRAKLSKVQGTELLRSVEEIENAKLEANTQSLMKMYGSEDQLIAKLENVSPIIKDKFGKAGEKVLSMLESTQYDPYLVEFALKAADAFKSDRHVKGNANYQTQDVKQDIQKRWSDPTFKARYRRGEADAIQEIDSLYNQIYK